MNGRFATVDDRFEHVNGRIDQLRSEVNGRFDRLDGDVQALTTRVFHDG